MNYCTHACLLDFKSIFQLIILITGLFGIGFALSGSINLFTQITFLNEIDPSKITPLPLNPDPTIQDLSDAVKHIAKTNEDLYKDLVTKLSDEIKRAAKVNDDNYRDARRRFMPHIIWGSVISALSLILSYAASTFN